jgi:putative toxin-antitoxin system antitoxin component (TIGR02293 family)
VDPSLASESAAVAQGLPASTWRGLQQIGFSRDEIASVLGNSAKTIRRKEDSDEPLDVAEGDRTMRLMRITTEAVEAFGDTSKAMTWLRRGNIALLGKTPLEMMATEAGTALVRRAIGVIGYGGVA